MRSLVLENNEWKEGNVMLTVYPAIFYHEQDGGYSVVFPDLHHLSTCGDSLSEAIEMAIDCLAGYLYNAKKYGEAIPAPTPLEKVDPHCEEDPDDAYPDDAIFVNLVSVDVEAYARDHFEKMVKKTLSIPKWMNDMAVTRKINFSKVLRQALAKELHVDSNGNVSA